MVLSIIFLLFVINKIAISLGWVDLSISQSFWLSDMVFDTVSRDDDHRFGPLFCLQLICILLQRQRTVLLVADLRFF